jgi:hypothetical protein
MPVEFIYVDIPLAVGNGARARVPRLQPSAINELIDVASDLVKRGHTTVDDSGVPLIEGLPPEEWINHHVSTRSHMLVPADVVDAGEACWLATENPLKAQGKRFNDLKAALGNDALAMVAFKEEARMFSTKPGNLAPGIKPGSKPDANAKTNSARNPWSYTFKGTDAERHAEMARIMKTGLAFATSLAKACGKSVTGAKLKA